MEPNNQQNARTVKWNPSDFPTPDKPTIGIKFYNINSGEERMCDTEALITAFYNSSNLHVNATVGQDLGWRLSKETVRRMRDIQEDEEKMEKIVRRFRLNEESEVTDSHVLTYIFQQDLTNARKSEESKQGQFARQYEEDIRSLDDEPSADQDDGEGDGPAPLKPAAAPRRNVRLTPAQQKALDDSRKREANLEAGRPINEGIDQPPEQPQEEIPEEELEPETSGNGDDGADQAPPADEAAQDEGSGEGSEPETAPEPTPEKPANKPASRSGRKPTNKPVAKPTQNSDNEA